MIQLKKSGTITEVFAWMVQAQSDDSEGVVIDTMNDPLGKAQTEVLDWMVQAQFPSRPSRMSSTGWSRLGLSPALSGEFSI